MSHFYKIFLISIFLFNSNHTYSDASFYIGETEIIGISENNVQTYLGIPFAEPDFLPLAQGRQETCRRR